MVVTLPNSEVISTWRFFMKKFKISEVVTLPNSEVISTSKDNIDNIIKQFEGCNPSEFGSHFNTCTLGLRAKAG